jgi:signal transduction histidine kinase
MTGDETPGVPMDAHPDPVLAYESSNGQLRVTATNDAFEAVYEDGTDAAGQRLEAVFDRFGVVESPGEDCPGDQVARGDDVAVYLGGPRSRRSYVARNVTTSEDAGFLVFADVEDHRAVGGAVDVGDLASVLSHDLRNPLDVAKAHLRAARETGDDEHFDAVEAAHERIGTIIGDVLTLSRGEDAVDPSAAVALASAVETAWQSVETGDAALRTPDDLPSATGDPDHVRRLFENLFRNAVEHGGDDPRVTVGALTADAETDDDENDDDDDKVDDDDDVAGFYVADDGPGVPESEREAVFRPGYTTADGGTGLGLAIVERIVAAHGWTLDLTDSRDDGARFEVRFDR